MDATRLQVKFPVTDPSALDGEPFVRLFHEWIRTDALGELVIDVADYRHVPGGPGVVLIGHGLDVSLDFQNDLPGLLTFRKRGGPEGFGALVSDTLRRAARASALVEAAGLATFRTAAPVLYVPERLAAPNTEAVFEALAPVVVEAAQAVYGARPRLERVGDAKGPLSISLHFDRAPTFAELARG